MSSRGRSDEMSGSSPKATDGVGVSPTTSSNYLKLIELVRELANSSESDEEESSSGGSPRETSSGAVKLIDLRVAAREKMAKVGARLSEKIALVTTDLALNLHRVIRHERRPRHDKCINHVVETQTAATEKRLRKEQEAKERAEWQRAMAREWSAYKASRTHKSRSHTHLHHHENQSWQPQLLQGSA
uniref:Uncharacterized protein n=1 Tax=Physcomitrium patens TaxID=3218 RepID=A0A2K1IGE9_PHYPA|nr:hypothetical protein PHYPA_028947 [Physcomitrium patens]